MKDFLPSGWTHVTLNYLGPEDGQGIEGYFDGVQSKHDQYRSENSFSAGDGRVVVGRFETDRCGDFNRPPFLGPPDHFGCCEWDPFFININFFLPLNYFKSLNVSYLSISNQN